MCYLKTADNLMSIAHSMDKASVGIDAENVPSNITATMGVQVDDFHNQLYQLSTDASVKSYFSNKNIFEFVKQYIQVDKLIGTCDATSSDTVVNKLDEIKAALADNFSQLNNLHTHVTNGYTNMSGLLQNKIDAMNNSLKDITNTEIKGMFVEMQKQLTAGLDTHDMRTVLENFKDKIENLNSQKLNDFDRKTLEMMSTIQTTMLQSLDTHAITHKIASIESNLNNINEHFSNNSSKKGQLAEGVLINVITDSFPDTEIIDTSHLANSGDIQLVKENKPTILIDSKHFASKTVPKRDLDKFYADIQTHNCSGILCNAFGGIANKQHFEIDIVDKNILVFIHSHKFDPNVFQLAVNIIYGMHEQIKDKQQDSVTIDQRLYQNLKIEYNYYIQSFRHHLDIIKTNVNSLSQLSFTLLDNFFKRKATTVELKGYSCHLCGTGCKTEKILKTHLKRQHPNIHKPPLLEQPVVAVTSRPKGRPKAQKVDTVVVSPSPQQQNTEHSNLPTLDTDMDMNSQSNSNSEVNSHSDLDEYL